MMMSEAAATEQKVEYSGNGPPFDPICRWFPKRFSTGFLLFLLCSISHLGISVFPVQRLPIQRGSSASHTARCFASAPNEAALIVATTVTTTSCWAVPWLRAGKRCHPAPISGSGCQFSTCGGPSCSFTSPMSFSTASRDYSWMWRQTWWMVTSGPLGIWRCWWWMASLPCSSFAMPEPCAQALGRSLLETGTGTIKLRTCWATCRVYPASSKRRRGVERGDIASGAANTSLTGLTIAGLASDASWRWITTVHGCTTASASSTTSISTFCFSTAWSLFSLSLSPWQRRCRELSTSQVLFWRGASFSSLRPWQLCWPSLSPLASPTTLICWPMPWATLSSGSRMIPSQMPNPKQLRGCMTSVCTTISRPLWATNLCSGYFPWILRVAMVSTSQPMMTSPAISPMKTWRWQRPLWGRRRASRDKSDRSVGFAAQLAKKMRSVRWGSSCLTFPARLHRASWLMRKKDLASLQEPGWERSSYLTSDIFGLFAIKKNRAA